MISERVETITEIEKLETELSKKLINEYNEFMENLINKTVEEIINSSYEKVCKEEMLHLFDDKSLSKEEYKALIKSPNLLETFYMNWKYSDGGIHTVFEDSIQNSIKKITNDYRNKIKPEKVR